MTDSVHNPYQSPSLSEARRDAKSPAMLTTEGALAQAIFGLWAGVLFGGTFGAGGSALLCLTDAALLGWAAIGPGIVSVEQFVLTEIMAAIAGAICGLTAGAVIGPVAALAGCLARQRSAAIVMCLTIGLSIVAGAAIGILGTKVATANSETSLFAAIVGMLIGSVAGLLGGLQLGRGIIDFASGQPDE